ncbi:MAG: riboflavin biosynthesis protein RibF [Planctomycetes bacterium]|nr:riboflavin biosynthesis protein RibF [Planctomycetota bacterium]MBL7008669.1 riboflavin biosynthesis protein RibF [Planctomycetota bacterium]
MLRLDGLGALPARSAGGRVATVGVFDGVHLGHFVVMRQVVERARALGAAPTVVTFAGHPKEVLVGRAPATVTSLAHRLLLFERAGIGTTLVLDFTPELRELTAAQFTRRVLVDGLGVRELVLGFDSKFGKDRSGTAASLQPLAAELGVVLVEVPPLRLEERAVSSSAIREAVQLGELDRAAAMLGRPVSLLGSVIRGHGRGREIGFPTANLDPHHVLRPPDGVYAVMVLLDGRLRPAVANIGERPTFGSPGHSVEVHLLDFDGDLYGRELEVYFLERLRGEGTFAGAAELGRQIGRDVEAARRSAAAAPERWVIPGAYLPIEHPGSGVTRG